MSHPEGFNPAARLSIIDMQPHPSSHVWSFRPGEWIRCTHPAAPQVGRFRRVHLGKVEIEKPDGLILCCNPEWASNWSPLPGERVRVTKCNARELVGFVGQYKSLVDHDSGSGESRHLVFKGDGSEAWWFAGDTEFEPVFEERETPPGVTHSITTRALGPLPPASFNGIEFPGPAPDVRLKPSEALAREAERKMKADVARMRETALDAIAADMGMRREPSVCDPNGVNGARVRCPESVTERTHYDRKPRGEREEARLAQVMAVLDPNWKGRR